MLSVLQKVGERTFNPILIGEYVQVVFGVDLKSPSLKLDAMDLNYSDLDFTLGKETKNKENLDKGLTCG
jgi:hypothetical protein